MSFPASTAAVAPVDCISSSADGLDCLFTLRVTHSTALTDDCRNPAAVRLQKRSICIFSILGKRHFSPVVSIFYKKRFLMQKINIYVVNGIKETFHFFLSLLAEP